MTGGGKGYFISGPRESENDGAGPDLDGWMDSDTLSPGCVHRHRCLLSEVLRPKSCRVEDIIATW